MATVDRRTVWPYDEAGEPGAFIYQRYAHPTGTEAERKLGELEGGDALLYASGTSAVTACVLAFCRPGAKMALAEGAYFGTGVTLAQFEPWGLQVVEYDQTGAPPADADIVWVEAPANPILTQPDWDAVRAHDALVVCDATLSTPVFLHALDEGADVVVHSATKYLTGHSRRDARRDRDASRRTDAPTLRRADETRPCRSARRSRRVAARAARRSRFASGDRPRRRRRSRSS